MPKTIDSYHRRSTSSFSQETKASPKFRIVPLTIMLIVICFFANIGLGALEKVYNNDGAMAEKARLCLI